MGCDRPISTATNRTGVASQTASDPRVGYFGPASMIDVMFEVGGAGRSERNIGLLNIVQLARALRVKPMQLIEPIP
jgi:hypothetical protein